MNNYNRDLHFDVVIPRMKAMSVAHVLKSFSMVAEKELNISAARLYELLLEKEDKESSGVGEGLAIPHIQVKGPRKALSILATLDKPLDFNSFDSEPSDLVALILSPETDGPYHLRRLSRISRLLKNETLHAKLCDAKDEDAIHSLLIDPEGWLLAA